jgi:trimethylamine:corrinoid methyltransferase-like protein
VWRPRFYDRTPYEQWLREGRRQSADLAGELVQRTLAEHAAPPLDAGCAAKLQEIVHEVGKETR